LRCLFVVAKKRAYFCLMRCNLLGSTFGMLEQ